MRLKKFHVLLLVAFGGNVVLVMYIANLPTDVCSNDSMPWPDWHKAPYNQGNSLDDKTTRGSVVRTIEKVTAEQTLFSSYNVTSFGKAVVDKNIEDELTIIIREFEDFDNDIPNVVSLIRQVFPSVAIVIVCDLYPYPSLDLPSDKNIRYHRLHFSPDDNGSNINAWHFIKTEFSLLLPDTAVVLPRHVIEAMISYQKQSGNHLDLVGAKVGIHPILCRNVKFDVKQWTVQYTLGSDESSCDSIANGHAVLIRTEQLLNLPYPFLRPFPEAVFIQSSLRNWKIRLSSERLTQSKILFTEPHFQWKHKTLTRQRWEHVYKTLGIKKLNKSDGTTEWYGCSKSTSRCFGTVLNDVPEYLFQNRWTPPCCLRHLREAAKHVFSILQQDGVRYWLEGGSLLGAVRNNDIIPWDYDIDIGIYKEDINKSDLLVAASASPTDDSQGYIWQRSNRDESDFFRVQYSDTNHLHVDIFPFYSRNGTMTKDTWMKSHRQDTEFPERYLKPLDKMMFAGILVSVPNSAREFLELKFGKGVIENPQYPKDVLVP